MRDDPMLSRNPTIEDAEKVLRGFFRRKIPISPELCTKAIVAEINRSAEAKRPLLQEERKRNYRHVGERFKVIEGDTVLVVADKELKQRLCNGQADWKEIQRKSVSVLRDRVNRYRLSELVEGVFDWNLRYDSFLGIMAGVLDVERIMQKPLA